MRIDKLKDIEKEIKKLASTSVKVGIFDSSIAEYATFNEYGTENIPARSFMRSTEREQDGWKKDIASAYDKLIFKQATSSKVLSMVGEKVKNDIKDKILSNIPPPNAVSTLKRKKGTKTLIDTGAMLNSVTYQVSNDV